MRAFTFTFKLWTVAALMISAAMGASTLADTTLNPTTPDEEDYSTTPHTEYGEFNEASDEADATLFYQFGKFFGVSLGGGYEGVTGNRGLLWQGGFPAISLKVHYWFDFNFALQMEFYTASHYYVDGTTGINVNMSRVGLDLKYYFDLKNLSAALTFANPYIALGIGAYSKSEIASLGSTTPSSLATFGVAAGLGLEFVIVPKKTYFTLEAKYHIANFTDQFSSVNGLSDLTGNYYTTTGNILFTW